MHMQKSFLHGVVSLAASAALVLPRNGAGASQNRTRAFAARIAETQRAPCVRTAAGDPGGGGTRRTRVSLRRREIVQETATPLVFDERTHRRSWETSSSRSMSSRSRCTTASTRNSACRIRFQMRPPESIPLGRSLGSIRISAACNTDSSITAACSPISISPAE